MHESDKAELRRLIYRVLQKDFRAVSPAQFEQWSKQVLGALAALEQSMALTHTRLAALEAQLARLEDGALKPPSAESDAA